MNTHACVHRHKTHARMHAHRCTCAYAQAQVCVRVHKCARAGMHTWTAYTHAHLIHARTCIHMNTCTYTRVCAHAHTRHTHTHRHTHAQGHAHTHTCGRLQDVFQSTRPENSIFFMTEKSPGVFKKCGEGGQCVGCLSYRDQHLLKSPALVCQGCREKHQIRPSQQRWGVSQPRGPDALVRVATAGPVPSEAARTPSQASTWLAGGRLLLTPSSFHSCLCPLFSGGLGHRDWGPPSALG